MGLLDLFDDPNILGAILGATNGGPPPMLPPGMGGGAPTAAPPSVSADGVPAMPQQGPQGGPAPTAAPPNMPPDWTSFPNVAGGRIAGALPPTSAPSLVTPAEAAPAGPMSSGGAGAPTLPANYFGPEGPPPGPPMNQNLTATPVPAPVAQPGPYDRMAAALGAIRAANPVPQISPWRNAMAGLGAGMSAVGAERPGANAGQSFAAGFGGSLQGGNRQNNVQIAQQRQAQNDLFNQSSAAFRDMMLAQNQGDMETYRKAQAAYLSSRAALMQNGGTAWQSASPYGRMIQVENEVNKYEKGQQIMLQKQWGLNTPAPEDQQAQLQQVQKRVDAYRNNLYKAAGLDPNKYNPDMGNSPDHPIPASGMSRQQFLQEVPEGGWYDIGSKYDKNGSYTIKNPDGSTRTLNGKPGAPVVLQRVTVPQNQPQQPQQGGAGDYTADIMASSPAYSGMQMQ